MDIFTILNSIEYIVQAMVTFQAVQIGSHTGRKNFTRKYKHCGHSYRSLRFIHGWSKPPLDVCAPGMELDNQILRGVFGDCLCEYSSHTHSNNTHTLYVPLHLQPQNRLLFNFVIFSNNFLLLLF